MKNKLQNLCERYKIEYSEQEESYNSRASFLDKDVMPVYNPNDETEYKFSGKRIKRGLYRSKEGITVSADLNGSANIAVKVKNVGSDWIRARECSGFLG